MHVRCTYCRQSNNLSRDFMIQAVSEAQEKNLKYIKVECNNCRKQIKVPVSQMRRFVPKTPAESEEEAA